MYKDPREKEEKERDNGWTDEEEQATGSHTDTLRRGEGTGFNLCFLVDTTPHLTHTHANTHADRYMRTHAHRVSRPYLPLSLSCPVLDAWPS